MGYIAICNCFQTLTCSFYTDNISYKCVTVVMVDDNFRSVSAFVMAGRDSPRLMSSIPSIRAAAPMDGPRKQQCVACGKPAISRCPFCTIRFYCSRDCQILDWKQNSHNTKCTRNNQQAAPQPPPASKPAPPAASSKKHASSSSAAPAVRPEQPNAPPGFQRPAAPYAPQHGMPRIHHPMPRPPYYGVPMWGAPPPNMAWPPLPGQQPDRRQSATPPNILPAPQSNSKEQTRRPSVASQTPSGAASRPGSAGASAPGSAQPFGRQVSHPHVSGASLAQPGSRPAASSGVGSAGQVSAGPVTGSLLVLSDSSSSSDNSGDEGADAPGRVTHVAAAADPPRPPSELKAAGMSGFAGVVKPMERSHCVAPSSIL